MNTNILVYAVDGGESTEQKKTPSLVISEATPVPHPFGGYNVPCNPNYPQITKHVFSLYKQTQKPPRILDIGAGRGTCLEFLASCSCFSKVVIQYRAVEMIPEMRTQLINLATEAKTRSPKSEFKINTESNLDFFDWASATRDEPYDVITAQLFLHYCDLTQIPLFFDHIVKLLKPGGILFLSVDHDASQSGLKFPTCLRNVGNQQKIFILGYSSKLLSHLLECWGFDIASISEAILPTHLNGQNMVMPVILSSAILTRPEGLKNKHRLNQFLSEQSKRSLTKEAVTISQLRRILYERTGIQLKEEEYLAILQQPGGLETLFGTEDQ